MFIQIIDPFVTDPLQIIIPDHLFLDDFRFPLFPLVLRVYSLGDMANYFFDEVLLDEETGGNGNENDRVGRERAADLREEIDEVEKSDRAGLYLEQHLQVELD